MKHQETVVQALKVLHINYLKQLTVVYFYYLDCFSTRSQLKLRNPPAQSFNSSDFGGFTDLEDQLIHVFLLTLCKNCTDHYYN